MSNHDEFENTQDDWTPDERRLFAALPLERIPPHELKARTVQAVRGLNPVAAHSRRSPFRTIAIAGAAAVIFVAGTLVGYLAATRPAQPPRDSHAPKREAVAGAERESPSIQQVRYVVWY